MNKTTILIVEDEAIVAADLANKLKRLGYEVAGIAAGGEEAVALAGEVLPHLILMDIRLEGSVDGVEAAELIRRRHDVPMIYLTAHSDAATLSRAKLTGPFGYILKPFEERDLATQIELALYKHRADREVRDQREWLRVTLTSIGDAVIATDAEGRVTFVNPVAETLTGWKAEEVSGQLIPSVFRVVNEQTGEALEEPVARVLREGRVVALANHAALVTKEGRTVPIEDSAAPILNAEGQVIGAVLVFHDVTKRRKAEKDLLEAHEKAVWLARFPEENPNPVLRVADDGIVLYCNPATAKTDGWECEADKVLQKELLPLIGRAFAENKTKEDDVEIGGKIYSAWVTPFPGERYANLYARDVTDRKQMEEKLRRSRDELELRVRERTAELELRNKELQDFAFVASHDLQEPLRKVQTFGKMLADKCGMSLDETSRDYLKRMEKATARMQSLLNSLLSYSRVTTRVEPVQETDLRRSVDGALSNLEIMIREKNAAVEVGDLPRVKADRVQMIQLFQNLIGNALKFGQDGQTSHVKVYALQVRDANGAYEICVEDNGIGFDEKYLDKIFLPFQRLHGRNSEYEGIGMGLAICRKIVERHGGRITARSEPGKGSSFIFTLPANRKER